MLKILDTAHPGGAFTARFELIAPPRPLVRSSRTSSITAECALTSGFQPNTRRAPLPLFAVFRRPSVENRVLYSLHRLLAVRRHPKAAENAGVAGTDPADAGVVTPGIEMFRPRRGTRGSRTSFPEGKTSPVGPFRVGLNSSRPLGSKPTRFAADLQGTLRVQLVDFSPSWAPTISIVPCNHSLRPCPRVSGECEKPILTDVPAQAVVPQAKDRRGWREARPESQKKIRLPVLFSKRVSWEEFRDGLRLGTQPRRLQLLGLSTCLIPGRSGNAVRNSRFDLGFLVIWGSAPIAFAFEDRFGGTEQTLRLQVKIFPGDLDRPDMGTFQAEVLTGNLNVKVSCGHKKNIQSRRPSHGCTQSALDLDPEVVLRSPASGHHRTCAAS